MTENEKYICDNLNDYIGKTPRDMDRELIGDNESLWNLFWSLDSVWYINYREFTSANIQMVKKELGYYK